MVRKQELYFDSRDNISKIHAVQWIPDTERPICILQIIHGMAEYVERYDDFAAAMAEKGILVVGEDHLGHGRSVGKGGTYGYFCEQDAATVLVRDAHRLKKMIQEKYQGVPYVILGHSMGSLILRNYLCRYGSGIQAAIIVGTGTRSGVEIMAGKAVGALQKLFLGSRHDAGFLDRNSFRTYNKRTGKKYPAFDWLCTDEAVVKAYSEDALCGFRFTVNGFQTIFELMSGAKKREYLEKMPKNLPILFAAGAEDPVGNYGKGVTEVYRLFLDIGMKDVQIKLYENDRHEILNETDKAEVYKDIYSWILSVINFQSSI